MKAAIKSFSRKVAKSLDSNSLKYVSESEIDALIEKINPNNKVLLKVNNSYISKANLENYLSSYLDQELLEVGNIRKPETDLNFYSKYQHETLNNMNQVVTSIAINNKDSFSENCRFLTDGDIKNKTPKSIESVKNSQIPYESTSSSRFQALGPLEQAFQGTQNERQELDFAGEKMQTHFRSADLLLNKLESILLGDYLSRFDNTLYTEQALMGELDFSNSGIQKRNDCIFIRYCNLKNVMEWDDEEFIEKSKYTVDSVENVPIAWTARFPHRAKNDFKRFFYKQLKAANYITEKTDKFNNNKRSRFKKIPFYFSSSKISTSSSKQNLPKRNPSRSLSRISLSAISSTKKSVSSLLRQKSFERANVGLASVFVNEASPKRFQTLPAEKLPFSLSNNNLESPNLSTRSFSQTPPEFVSPQEKNKKFGSARSLLREISHKKAKEIAQQKSCNNLKKESNSRQKVFRPWQSNKSLSSTSICYSPSITPVDFTAMPPIAAKRSYTELQKAEPEEGPDNNSDADPECTFISLYESKSVLSIPYDKSKYYAYSRFYDDAGL